MITTDVSRGSLFDSPRPGKTVRKAIADAERELNQLSTKLDDYKPIDIDAHILRKFAVAKIANLLVLFPGKILRLHTVLGTSPEYVRSRNDSDLYCNGYK
ncbi:MAG TPA: hypothetical protein VG897_05255 [Terriglobales bacterium]|nr:hypothetical protein [Terriglobales bacterium]